MEKKIIFEIDRVKSLMNIISENTITSFMNDIDEIVKILKSLRNEGGAVKSVTRKDAEIFNKLYKDIQYAESVQKTLNDVTHLSDDEIRFLNSQQGKNEWNVLMQKLNSTGVDNDTIGLLQRQHSDLLIKRSTIQSAPGTAPATGGSTAAPMMINFDDESAKFFELVGRQGTQDEIQLLKNCYSKIKEGVNKLKPEEYIELQHELQSFGKELSDYIQKNEQVANTLTGAKKIAWNRKIKAANETLDKVNDTVQVITKGGDVALNMIPSISKQWKIAGTLLSIAFFIVIYNMYKFASNSGIGKSIGLPSIPTIDDQHKSPQSGGTPQSGQPQSGGDKPLIVRIPK